MTPEQLRELMGQAASPGWDDDVRATSALYAGRQRRRQHRRRELALGGAAVLVGCAAGVVALSPVARTPATRVVLGCGSGVGSSGEGLVAGGVGGVTLSVDNPTTQVQAVTTGGTSVLAVPGSSQVTLPLPAGRATVRCGDGQALTLNVQHLSPRSHCTSVDTALQATVEQGAVEQLTRQRIGDLPTGVVIDNASSTDEPLQRVQVRSSGKVLAEAVWHAMPGEGDWQLESLSRCD